MSAGNRAIEQMLEVFADARDKREAEKPVTYSILRAAAALCLAGVRKMPELTLDLWAFKALCLESSDIEFAEHVEVLTCIGRVKVRPAL
jgi:hypothetical protein